MSADKIVPTNLQQDMMMDCHEKVTIVATGACVGKSTGLLLKALMSDKEYVFIVYPCYKMAARAFIDARKFFVGWGFSYKHTSTTFTLGDKSVFFINDTNRLMACERSSSLILADQVHHLSRFNLKNVIHRAVCGVETMFTSNPYDSSKLHWDYNNEEGELVINRDKSAWCLPLTTIPLTSETMPVRSKILLGDFKRGVRVITNYDMLDAPRTFNTMWWDYLQATKGWTDVERDRLLKGSWN